MKASTQEALKRAGEICASHGLELTPVGFQFHSERTWIGISENDDVIQVTIPKAYGRASVPDLQVFLFSASMSRELQMKVGSAGKGA